MQAGIVKAFCAGSKWEHVPAKRLFRSLKHVNDGMIETNRLALTMKGVINRALDDSEGLQSSDYSVYQVFEKDDLVFKLIDLENIKTSRVGLVHERGIMSPAYIRLTRTSKSLCSKFYYWYFFALYLNNIYNKLGGGIRQNLTPKELLEIPAPKIDTEAQVAIATFLDRETARIDNLIIEKQTFIKLLKEKRQALISHVVTKGLDPNVKMKDSGTEWIGEVPEHWECVPLKRLVRNIEQGWSPECHSNPAKENCWGVLKSGAVNRGVYQAQENKELPETLLPRPEIEVKKGDLIMSRASGSRELIGSAAYVYETRSKLMLSDKLFRLNCLDETNPEFVSICLGSYPLRRQIELAIGGAEGLANNLSQSNIKRLYLAKPPKAEQGLIVSALKKRLEGFDRIIAETSLSIELLREHRTALICAAVTGKIDVRSEVQTLPDQPQPQESAHA